MAFINIDIEKLLNEDGWIQITLDAGPAVQKRVSLSPPQMGMFNTLDITKFPDGTVWLDFLSDKYAPSKEVMDFMAYCSDKWGNDSSGRGVPNKDDISALRDGTFGRTWENVKLAQIKRPEHLSLTVILRIIIDNNDMSNFIKSLGEGFVRSAVNQVGRDSGRVISNNVYNDQDYVQVTNVSEQSASTPPPITATPSGVPQDAISSTKYFSAGKLVWLSILSIFLMPLGSLFVLLYGVFMLTDRSDKVEWYTSEPNYVRDRRYRSGVRYVGKTTKHHTAKVSASPEVMEIKKRNANLTMIIGGVGIILFTFIMIFAK